MLVVVVVMKFLRLEPDGVKRVIVTDPSSAEIVAYLDGVSRIAGRCDKCIRPRAIMRAPVVVRSSLDIDVNLPSRVIDELISSHIRSGGKLFELDYGMVESIDPDLIVGQSLCDVCAITPREIEEQLSSHNLAGYPIYDYSPRFYMDIPRRALRLAKLLDRVDRAERLLGDFEVTLDSVSDACTGLRIAVLEWIDPLYHAGLWTSDLLHLMGAETLIPPGVHGSRITTDMLLDFQPDIIVVVPCGFPVERTLREIHLLTGSTWWRRLKAVKSNMVFVVEHYLLDGATPEVMNAARVLEGICRRGIVSSSLGVRLKL